MSPVDTTRRPSVQQLQPVICVIDALHRDVRVADDACAGRFTHAGVTLDLGRRPDWIGGGLDDEEWRIEWVKLYEGLDLGHAFEVFGEPDYLTAWCDLVDSFIAQVPVGIDTSDVTARRVQNWLYAWQRLSAAPAFATIGLDRIEPFVARLTDRLVADVEHLADHLTAERNHRTMELYTLLLAGIALDDRTRAESALALLAANAVADICDDGVQRERSSDYHMLVLRSLVGAVANARAAGMDVPRDLIDRTQLAAAFGLQLQRPDGTTPALSDGDQADFTSLLRFAAAELDRPDLEWAATRGAFGVAPAQRHATFPTGGYAFQRSGWGDGVRPYGDERWAVLDCGPLGDGGHGHYDHLSVELAGAGRQLVVDPGRYTYAEDADAWRHRFKGTAAHNTVTVDGLDQTPYRRGKPKGATSTARLIRRHTASGAIAGDAIVAEATSPSYGAVHTRSLMLVDDDYWVVHDRLVDDVPRDYVARWHLDSSMPTPEVIAHGGITIAGNHELSITVPASCGAVTIERGWVSPAYGIKETAAVVVVTAPRGSSADLVTVITPGGRTPSGVRCTSEDGGSLDVTIDWVTHSDRVLLDADRLDVERTPC